MGTTFRRILATGFAVTIAGGLSLATISTANAEPPGKVTYCHATHSDTNPFVRITTAKTAVLAAHDTHQDGEDLIPSFDYVLHGVPGTFDGQTPGETCQIYE